MRERNRDREIEKEGERDRDTEREREREKTIFYISIRYPDKSQNSFTHEHFQWKIFNKV